MGIVLIILLVILIGFIYLRFIYEPKMRKLYPYFNRKDLDYRKLIPINFACKGLYYRTEKEKAYARILKVGDYLYLEKEPDNPRSKYAIKILSDSGIHIGYIEEFYAQYCSDHFNEIKACRITKITNGGDIPYIYAEAYFINKSAK